MQTADASKLLSMIETYADPVKGRTKEQLQEMRSLISVIEKRVKEGYKGFAQ